MPNLLWTEDLHKRARTIENRVDGLIERLRAIELRINEIPWTEGEGYRVWQDIDEKGEEYLVMLEQASDDKLIKLYSASPVSREALLHLGYDKRIPRGNLGTKVTQEKSSEQDLGFLSVIKVIYISAALLVITIAMFYPMVERFLSSLSGAIK